jgi:hypothetical protein
MSFVIGRPDLIRAISQRWLLDYWNRIRGDRKLPLWQGLEADGLEAISASLTFSDVVRDADQTRFMIRYYGSRVADAYGMQCKGKFLDEVMPAAILTAYERVVDARQPVYTVIDIPDLGGRIVHNERLLLPFGRDGLSVDRILTSLELVSVEGTFESHGLMNSQSIPPAYAVCATIQF